MKAVDAFNLFIERAEELRDSAFIQSGLVPELHARMLGVRSSFLVFPTPL